MLPEASERRPADLVRGSSWVMAGILFQALTGLGFWFLAARQEPSATIGLASACFASIQFINYATTLGLPEVLAAFPRPTREETNRFLTWAVTTTVAATLVGTFLYLVITQSPRVVDESFEGSFLAAWALLAVLGGGNAIAVLVDIHLMVEQRWRLVFARNVLVGLARIPLLWFLAVGNDVVRLLLAMTGAIAVSGYGGLIVIAKVTGFVPTLRGPALGATRMVRYAAAQYLSHVAVFAPQFLLPVLVLTNVRPAENANFFLAWAVTAVVSTVPMIIGRVLVVEESRPGTREGSHLRSALLFSCALMGLALVGSVPLRYVIIELYGSDFQLAADLLPRLVLGCLPWAVTIIALSLARARHDHRGSVLLTSVLAGSLVLLGLLLVPDHGARGAADAWVLSNSITLVLSLVILQRNRSTQTPHPGSRSGEATVR